MTTKICTGPCKTEKPLEEFYLERRNRRDGRQSQCRECHKEKERIRAQKPEVKARQLDRRYKNSYDMDAAAVAMMVLARNGKCDITGKVADLVVDHIEGTKIVRGLLSSTANTALGLFDHSIDNLLNGA